MSPQEKEQIISRIIKLELEICDSIFQRIKPTIDDSFAGKRQELNLLRCVLFGYNSDMCKIKKGSL